MTCGVYEIVNTLTKFRYVGQSKRIEERWVEHRRLLARGQHRHKLLQQAWIENGADSFKWKILEQLSVLATNAELCARERVWLHKRRDRLYNEKRIHTLQCSGKQTGREAAVWPFVVEKPFITRRHHLGPPAGIPERRSAMYSGRRDHIRLAEIRQELGRLKRKK